MKQSIDEHAARFDEAAAEYDESERPVYQACKQRVIGAAAVDRDDVVLDIGTGTGNIALALAGDAEAVIGRDISDGMLEEACAKAAEHGVENVSFGHGRFREPRVDRPVDVVTSNYAMHHLDSAGKREAIEVIAGLEPRRFVLGDLMFVGRPNMENPEHDPTVDDPATVGELAAVLTDAGFHIVDVTEISAEVGVIVADGTWE